MDMKKEPTSADLIRTIGRDCRQQAGQIHKTLTEVLAYLESENYLAALGSFSGLDDQITCLKTFLTRIAKLTAER